MSTTADRVAIVGEVDSVDSYSKSSLESARTWVSTPSTVSEVSLLSGVDIDLIRAAILPTRDLLMPSKRAISRYDFPLSSSSLTFWSWVLVSYSDGWRRWSYSEANSLNTKWTYPSELSIS